MPRRTVGLSAGIGLGERKRRRRSARRGVGRGRPGFKHPPRKTVMVGCVFCNEAVAVKAVRRAGNYHPHCRSAAWRERRAPAVVVVRRK